MSTHAAIILQVALNSYKGIYCHSDGYPEWVGRILKEHYTDIDKVKRLIELGDISCLGEEIGERHPFGSNAKEHAKWTRAYGRDREDPGTEPKEGSSWNDVAGQIDYEYIYLFEDGVWREVSLPSWG